MLTPADADLMVAHYNAVTAALTGGEVAVWHDGLPTAVLPDPDAAFTYLQRVQGQSCAYALTFGGWHLTDVGLAR